jgi:hypothetical protein
MLSVWPHCSTTDIALLWDLLVKWQILNSTGTVQWTTDANANEGRTEPRKTDRAKKVQYQISQVDIGEKNGHMDNKYKYGRDDRSKLNCLSTEERQTLFPHANK